MNITPNRARAATLRATADASFLTTRLPQAIDDCLLEILNPTGRNITGPRSKNTISDPTGMTVAQREEAIQRILEDEIEVPLDSLSASLALLMRFVAKWAPTTEKIGTCSEGQHGKDGAIEWGDPLCTRPAVKSGLCHKEYKAWYRWRKDTGRPTTDMFEPAVSNENH